MKRTEPRERKRPDRSIHEYSPGEEVANSVTHGIGALLGVVALILLIVKTVADNGGPVALAAAIIFGVTLVLEYTNSTLYHALTNDTAKRVFKVLDHSSIYLLIAGTYTPFTLITMANDGGMWMTLLIWGIALAGVATEAFWVFRPRWLAALLYLAMGWIIIFRFNVVLDNLAFEGVMLLLAGGIAYSLGIIFYVMKRVRYMHSIWHLFTVAGSTLHVLSVLLFVL
jgi:hemolysin III